jgi:hypothetical protein
MRTQRTWPACGLLVLAACSPALDWRELRPEGSGVVLLLPCKPNLQQRKLMLAGTAVTLTLAACSAAGATWALAYADVGEPARVATALDELRRSAATNIGAEPGGALPAAVPGATPNAGNLRFSLSGRLPDGLAVKEQVVIFARGTAVFQATVVGETLAAEAVETFLSSLSAAS